MPHRPFLLPLLALLLAPPGAARAAVAPVLNFVAENNDVEQELSSAADPMPRVASTFAVQIWLGSRPAAGRTIRFSVQTASGAASSLLTLDRSSAVTDADGKCFVGVVGAGRSVPDRTEVLVKAKHFDPLTGALVAMNTVRVLLRQSGASGAETPPWHPPLGAGGMIRYDDSALGITRAVAGAARDQWRAAGEIAFEPAAVGTLADLSYDEVESAEPWFGLTQASESGGRWRAKVRFNVYQLDPDRFAPALAWTKWSLRGHLLNTACHETGHALLLGHNGASQRSLMWPDVGNYFVWQTRAPRWDCDWPPVHAAYPG